MSQIDNIITIELFREFDVEEQYRCPMLIGFDHDRFLTRLLELGADWFEKNKVYAMLFDTTPPDRIEDMKNYKDITDKIHFTRLMGYAGWIGSHPESEWMNIANRFVDQYKFKIIEVVE